MIKQREFHIQTRGRGSYDISAEVNSCVEESGVLTGLCHVFVHHTSASLMLCENADPTVRQDLETFMQELVPDGSPMFKHTDEGPDDMPAHVRTLLSGTDLSIPVKTGRCGLGTWQGIYLWEHRVRAHRRLVTVTILG